MAQLPMPATGRRLTALVAAAAILATTASTVSADPGFRTSVDPMVEAARDDVEIHALISVGDTVGDYMFEAIPDGIAIDPRGTNTLDIYVNHETSLEPFPATKVDYTNSLLSKLTLKRGNGKVLEASYAIPSSANYQRFCSNFMAGPEQGLDRYLVLTNEEAVQTFNRTGTPSFPLGAGGSDPEQAGVVVAYDVDSGEYRSIHRMGRHNHENSVALPGYDTIAVLSGDDTFVSNPPQSQLYLYTAPDTQTMWDDGGSLWAFKADGADDDYYDVAFGEELSGEFIAVPDAIADGDQTALETWSQANGVFDFVRIEDIAYDRTTPNVVYLADSGRGSGLAPNGRVWRMELDPEDPSQVLSLRFLFDHDALGLKALGAIHQPDNLETTANSLLITEDPSSGNNYAPGSPDSTTARVWRYDLHSGELEVVLRADQALDPAANLGAWEISGVVDASQYFGNGAFLITVQAHTIFVGDQVPSPWIPTAIQKREGGQLLLVRIDGA
jgi:hypothetical protein